MSVTVSVNNTNYTIPQTDETGWGDNVTSWIQAISSATLQKSGGTFTLSAEVDFGASFGLKSLYFKGRNSNPAAAGIVRLANLDLISWRNAANSGDLSVRVNASDRLQFDSVNLVTISSTDTLTNKTLTSPVINSGTINTSTFDVETMTNQGSTPSTPSAGSSKFYVKTNGSAYLLNSAGVEQQIGSGGAGVQNYITNSNFENTLTTGWNLLTATITSGLPTGAPTVGSAASITTFATTNSSPLAGSYSLSTASSAAWAQGAGIITDALTLNAEDQAKVLTISGYYTVVSGASNGNFSGTSSNTFAIYVYDATNSAWIQPAGVYNIVQSSGSGRFIANFQTPSNLASFRVAIVAINASGGAISLKWDDFFCGPQAILYGAPVSDWTAYTPTGAQTTNTTYSGFYRRVGDSMHCVVTIAYSGAPDSTTVTASIPSGFTIDTAKITTTGSPQSVVGNASGQDGTNGYSGSVHYNTTTTVILRGPSNVAPWTQASPFSFGASDYIHMVFVVPITGWSSTVLMSNDTDTRAVIAQVTGDPASATTGNPIIFPTVTFDTHGAYNASTGGYTAPVPGYYKIYGAGVSSNAAVQIYAFVAGVQRVFLGTTDSNGEIQFVGTVLVTAGQVIDVRPVGGTLDISSGVAVCNFERLSGPSVIGATDSIAALAETNTARSISNNAATTGEFLCEDRVFDTTSSLSLTTAIFTVPVPGKYRVGGCVEMTSGGGWGVGERLELQLFKGGSINRVMGSLRTQAANTEVISVEGTTTVSCVAGDTLEVRVFQNSGAALNTSADQTKNWVSYERIGN